MRLLLALPIAGVCLANPAVIVAFAGVVVLNLGVCWALERLA